MMSTPIPSSSNTTRLPKEKANTLDVKLLNNLNLKDMVDIIQNAHPRHWTEQSATIVCKHLDYPDEVIDVAFTRLYKSEKKARFFIVKSHKAQK